MADWNSFGIVLILLTVSTYGQELHVDISAQSVPEGGAVTMRCTLTGTGKINMVYWYKRQGDVRVHIATNNLANEGYDFQRYVYDVEEGPDGNSVIFLLNIDGAINADSGEFGCESPQVLQEPQFLSLVVTRPVEQIKLFSMPGNDSSQQAIREYEDGEHVDFIENDLYFFKCAVTGSNPAPNMTVTLGEFNVTDKFVYEDMPLFQGDEPPFNEEEHTTFLTTAEPLQVHYQGNALDFRCSAWVENTEPMSIYIVPVLRFAPVLDCPDYIRVPIDTKDLDMECVVRSEPVCEDIYWTLYRDDGSNITLDPKKTATWGNLWARIQPGEHTDQARAILNIEHVFIEHFRSYRLTATTDLGTTTHLISLERDEKAESAGGGATGLIASFILLVTSLTGSALYRRL